MKVGHGAGNQTLTRTAHGNHCVNQRVDPMYWLVIIVCT